MALRIGFVGAGDNWQNYVLDDFFDAVIKGRESTTVPYDEGIRSLAVSLADYASQNRDGAVVSPQDLIADVFGNALA
ncbi:MAG: hypothetical protein KAI66_13530 [Lentisphaeria bacterium]|nr:hypothetical protein [Lentisphaeria bacterium]